ncbi:MAG: response regulator [Candidatus Omnitrophota bacterium]
MSKKILLVDDEPDLRQIIGFRLKKMGYDVAVAFDGPAALSMAESEKPDLILLDVMMPGIDGFEVCKRLRANKFSNKILIYTAKVEAINATKAREAGADDFTVKTTNLTEIIEAIKRLLA